MAGADSFVSNGFTKYLMTWNSQGNKFAALKSFLDVNVGKASKINVVCCQEFGSPAALGKPDKVTTEYSYSFVPFTTRADGMHVFWHSWSLTHKRKNQSDNLRCTVAIIRCGKQADVPKCEVLLEDAVRPAIGIQYASCWIYSFHNNASFIASNTANSMLSWVEKNNQDRKWMVAGDFNCRPGDLAAKYKTRYDPAHTTTRRTVGTGLEIPNNLYD